MLDRGCSRNPWARSIAFSQNKVSTVHSGGLQRFTRLTVTGGSGLVKLGESMGSPRLLFLRSDSVRFLVTPFGSRSTGGTSSLFPEISWTSAEGDSITGGDGGAGVETERVSIASSSGVVYWTPSTRTNGIDAVVGAGQLRKES